MSDATLSHLSLAEVRDMIGRGFTDDMIQSENDERADSAIESAVAADEYHRRYGDDYNDDSQPSGAVSAYNDRLSMGRNDAGEWLGFM